MRRQERVFKGGLSLYAIVDYYCYFYTMIILNTMLAMLARVYTTRVWALAYGM